jgi:hypothetical protein
VLQEPAETRHDVEVGGAWASTAHFPGGESHGAVCETHDAVVGDGDLENRGGAGGAGGVAVGLGLAVDGPGEGPDLGSDVRQQSGVAHGFLEEGAGEGGERCDRDKAGGPGGPPGRAVLGEASARDKRVEVGVVLQWPAAGVQDAGAPWEIGPEEARVGGEAFEGRGRRVQQGLVGEALMRAEEEAEGLGDGKGHEKMWPRQLLVQVVLEPLLRCMLLTLGTVPVTTGMLDAVVSATAWALRAAMAILSALALLEGMDGLALRGGEVRIPLQVLGRKGGADSAEGHHGRSPCRRVLRRS